MQGAQGRRILEVGNVLSHYYPTRHDVVDKYERSANVIQLDVADFQPEQLYDLVISVSTLEHVGWDERPRAPEKLLEVLGHLRCLLAPGGQLLATVPLGYNDALDQWLREGRVSFAEQRYLRRVARFNRWEERGLLTDVVDAKYNSPYACASAVLVGLDTAPR